MFVGRNCYNVDNMLYIAWRKWRNRRFRGFGPSYTVIPYLASSTMSSFMYIKNMHGPTPLPCTTPLSSWAMSDIAEPTLVWCVRPERKFFIHNNTVPRI